MELKKVGVVGCGLMGHGIVQVAAQAGFEVVAVESAQEYLDKGLARIERSLAKLAQKSVERKKATAEEAEATRAAAWGRITGSIDIKKALFAELGAICKPEAMLASNTSSFKVTEMAEASGRPARFVSLHFFNPVQLMRLVEVVRTDATDADVFETARGFGKAVGKALVACKSTPGFVVNRLLVPYMSLALLMLDRGDASKEDIAAAMQFGCGYRMSPRTLTRTDYVGLDTTLTIPEGWVKDYPDEPAFVIPEILGTRVAEGKLGRKTAKGFCKWDGGPSSGGSPSSSLEGCPESQCEFTYECSHDSLRR